MVGSYRIASKAKTGVKHYSAGPTEEGIKVGITEITLKSRYGTHIAYLLNREAQGFVIDNIDSFLGFRTRSGINIKT